MRLVLAGSREQRHPSGPRLRYAVTGAAAVVCLLAAGCSSASTPASTSLINITVDAQPNVADAPLFLGIQQGIFRQAGIRVTVLPNVIASHEVETLESGKADIAFTDYPDMFYAHEQPSGSSLQVLADGYDCGQAVMEVMTYPGSGITTPQQLAGKTIAIPSAQGMPVTNASGQPVPFSLETFAAWSALKASTVNPASIHWAQQQDPAILPGELGAAGGYSLILATEPNIYDSEYDTGAVPVLDLCSGATANLPLDGYFTTSTFASSQPAALAAFRSALMKAQAAATASPSSVNAILQNAADFDSDSAALVTLGTYPSTLVASDLQRVATLMLSDGALAKPLSVASMINS